MMSKLFELLNKGEFVVAEKLISEEKVNINSYEYKNWVRTDYDGDGYYETRTFNYLPAAFSNNRLDIAEFLLSHGANFNKHADTILNNLSNCDSDYAFKALQVIIKYKNSFLLGNNFLHLLSKKKADTHSSYPQFDNPDSSCFSFSSDQIQTLFQGIAFNYMMVNQEDMNGDTPIHLAIKNNHPGMTKWLLETNLADLTVEDGNKNTINQLLKNSSDKINEIFILNSNRNSPTEDKKFVSIFEHQATLFSPNETRKPDTGMVANFSNRK